MKILALSDIHLEDRSDQWSYKSGSADVVVLAGDIHTNGRGVAWAQKTFDCPVIYVLGNHEGWRSHWGKIVGKMKESALGSNVHVLHNNELVLDGVRFLGSTLWTGFDLLGLDKRQQAMNDAGAGRDMYSPGMRDYKYIRTEGYRKLLPRDTLAWNTAGRSWLREKSSETFDGPTVVVTHHPPMPDDKIDLTKVDMLDAAYFNNWEEGVKMLGAECWIHGHTHHPYRRQVDQTLMVSHAVGHVSERLPQMYQQILEVTKGHVLVHEPEDIFVSTPAPTKEKKKKLKHHG